MCTANLFAFVAFTKERLKQALISSAMSVCPPAHLSANRILIISDTGEFYKTSSTHSKFG